VPIAVTTAPAATVEWPVLYEAGGVVRARHLAVVSSRVVAPVTEVRVQAGDRVRRGQVLAVLDGRELQAHAARATAAASGSSLGLEAAQAEHQAATAALTLARASFERVRGLKEKNSATAQEMDEAQATLSGAEARVAGARARVAEAEQGVTAARASQDASAVGVSYTTLTAPFDGLVAARHADPGTLAAPGSPLLTVEDTQAYRLEAAIDGAQARLVTVGGEAEARLDGGDWAGRLAAAFVHSKLTPLIIVASLLLGLYAGLALPREEEPQIIVPMVDVFVEMPGASPAEVEQRVTRPMEKLLWEVPGVEYIYSTSSPGRAMVIVRFLVGQDEEQALVR
jgi:biotin carboxyl carrier protein